MLYSHNSMNELCDMRKFSTHNNLLWMQCLLLTNKCLRKSAVHLLGFMTAKLQNIQIGYQQNSQQRFEEDRKWVFIQHFLSQDEKL